MRLEDVTAEIRPRAPWESVDLGCSLARRHIGTVWKAWLVTVVPLWLVLALLLHNHPVWMMLIVWWLKPVYDRVPLMVLSRALFGSSPTAWEVLKSWPRLLVRRLPFALLLGRFSPSRSLSLPVAELEGLRGRAYSQRVSLLERNGGEGATMATLVGFLLEIVTALGVVLLALMMVPEHIVTRWLQGIGDFFVHSDITDLNSGFFWLAAGVQMLAISLMEPFYVSAGFALYINSRTLTEGWDIELAFKRLGARLRDLREGKKPSSGIGVAVLLAVAALFFTSQPAQAADRYQESAREVLQHEDFTVHHREVKVRVEEESSSGESPFLEWLGDLLKDFGLPGFMGLVGQIVFYVILTAVIAGLVYLIYKNRHIFQSGGRRGKGGGAKPKTEAVMGMDVRPESLPDDVVSAARKAWADGDAKLALSLLYRSSIAWLVHRADLPIEESDTEGDCVRRADALRDQSVVPYFKNLTYAWVDVAYGRRELAGERFDGLCAQWPFHTSGGRPMERRGV